MDYQSLRSYNSKFPEPAPEPEEIEEHQNAIVDVVFNVYKERRDGHSIALRISFRLPEKG